MSVLLQAFAFRPLSADSGQGRLVAPKSSFTLTSPMSLPNETNSDSVLVVKIPIGRRGHQLKSISWMRRLQPIKTKGLSALSQTNSWALECLNNVWLRVSCYILPFRSTNSLFTSSKGVQWVGGRQKVLGPTSNEHRPPTRYGDYKDCHPGHIM